MLCRVDLCIDDAEPQCFKVAANSGKQEGLIRRVDDDLQPFADWRQPRLDHRGSARDMSEQEASLPCDIRRVMSEKVGHIQLTPQLRFNAIAERVQPEQSARLLLFG